MQNSNVNKSSLDKSNYVKSINESKISKRKPKGIDCSISRDISSRQDQSSVIIQYKTNDGEFNNENIENVISEPDVKIELQEEDKNKNTNKNLSSISNIPIDSNILYKKMKTNNATPLKDISEISQNSNFIIRNSIQNSLFNADNNLETERLEEEFESHDTLERDFNLNLNLHAQTVLNDSIMNTVEEEKRLGEIFFHKILNAQCGEEIILPEQKIQMKGLLISKPVKIIGQPNCVLEITEGPISINISENYENEVVKFSQIKILFNICDTEKSIIKNFKGDHAKFTVLFRLYPGSLVEIEDCDISCTKDNTIPISKHKLICFQLMYCKYIGKPNQISGTSSTLGNNPNSPLLNTTTNNNNNNKYNGIISPTILSIMSSRIEKFYQTIRSAENCIINIEKSFINKNFGKPLCILNPLIIKVVSSIFEGNGDNAIHLKFVKDDNLLFDSRKLFIKNTEFAYNFGTGVYIDGIENFIFDLEITIESNTFKKNKGDAVFMLDLFVKSLNIRENKFLFGKSNGLNLNKVYHKTNFQMNTQNTNTHTSASETYTQTQELPLIEIKQNDFIENNGFGIFMNDCKAQILSNSFFQNNGCGIILININNQNKDFSSSENNINNNNNSSLNNIYSPGTCYLHKNSFIKNGSSGIRIINYNHLTYISECYFKENVEYGIHIEVASSIIFLTNNGKDNINNFLNQNVILSSEKIKMFKQQDNTKMPKETNLYLLNSTIVNNMKSGINFNNCFIFLENTIISDNLDYAIYTPKEEYRYCYKQSKSSQKNMLQGNVGGPWGEISINHKTLCNGCSSTTKIKKRNKDDDGIKDMNNIVVSANSNYMVSSSNSIPMTVVPGNSSSKKANSDNSNAVNQVKEGDSGNKEKCLIN